MNPFDRLRALRAENDAVGDEMDAQRARFEGYRTRHEDGTAPRAIAAFNLFQTPQPLAAELVALAGIQEGDSVLEPSAGLGRLLYEVVRFNPVSVTACELAADCAREIYEKFPQVKLIQGDFLERDLGLFDRIVMNPPFKMRRDIKHIEHALTHLKVGGRLSGLCLSGSIRERALRDRCDTWEIIPAGAFKAEGTNVESVLFSITG